MVQPQINSQLCILFTLIITGWLCARFCPPKGDARRQTSSFQILMGQHLSTFAGIYWIVLAACIIDTIGIEQGKHLEGFTVFTKGRERKRQVRVTANDWGAADKTSWVHAEFGEKSRGTFDTRQNGCFSNNTWRTFYITVYSSLSDNAKI